MSLIFFFLDLLYLPHPKLLLMVYDIFMLFFFFFNNNFDTIIGKLVKLQYIMKLKFHYSLFKLI
jgi:hypothetical protein